MKLPINIGELKKFKYKSVSVKEEMRNNLILLIKNKKKLFLKNKLIILRKNVF